MRNRGYAAPRGVTFDHEVHHGLTGCDGNRAVVASIAIRSWGRQAERQARSRRAGHMPPRKLERDSMVAFARPPRYAPGRGPRWPCRSGPTKSTWECCSRTSRSAFQPCGSGSRGARIWKDQSETLAATKVAHLVLGRCWRTSDAENITSLSARCGRHGRDTHHERIRRLRMFSPIRRRSPASHPWRRRFVDVLHPARTMPRRPGIRSRVAHVEERERRSCQVAARRVDECRAGRRPGG